MHEPNKHGAVVGALVLYTRANGAAFPMIVAETYAYGAVRGCSFTPAPETVWTADYDASGKPGTWRHMPKAT